MLDSERDWSYYAEEMEPELNRLPQDHQEAWDALHGDLGLPANSLVHGDDEQYDYDDEYSRDYDDDFWPFGEDWED